MSFLKHLQAASFRDILAYLVMLSFLAAVTQLATIASWLVLALRAAQ